MAINYKSYFKLFVYIFMLLVFGSFVSADEKKGSNSLKDKDLKRNDDLVLGMIANDLSDADIDIKSPFCSIYGDKKLKKGILVPISGIRSCNSSLDDEIVYFYEIFIKGKLYYVRQSDVILTEEDKVRLDKIPDDETLQLFKDKTAAFSLYIYKKQVDDISKAIKRTSKNGLTILTHRIYDTSEYTDGTGFSVSIMNPSKKTIKYVSFTVIGYNPVKDPVILRKGKKYLTVKGVGPIKQNESSTYEWDYLWFTDLVSTHKITSILIEYMDGSKRSIKNINDITLPYEQYMAMKDLNDDL